MMTNGPKPASQTLVVRLLILAVIAGPFAVIGLLWLATAVLSPEDAQAFKEPLMAIWQNVAGAAVVGSVFSSILRTIAKSAGLMLPGGEGDVTPTQDASAQGGGTCGQFTPPPAFDFEVTQ